MSGRASNVLAFLLEIYATRQNLTYYITMSKPYFSFSEIQRIQYLCGFPGTEIYFLTLIDRMGRFGQNRHSERDPKNPPYPRGRPVADIIDTVGEILLFYVGFG